MKSSYWQKAFFGQSRLCYRSPVVCDVKQLHQPSVGSIRALVAQRQYENKVNVLPKHLDKKVAVLRLEKIGVELETLSTYQSDNIGVKVEGPFKPQHFRY